MFMSNVYSMAFKQATKARASVSTNGEPCGPGRWEQQITSAGSRVTPPPEALRQPVSRISGGNEAI